MGNASATKLRLPSSGRNRCNGYFSSSVTKSNEKSRGRRTGRGGLSYRSSVDRVAMPASGRQPDPTAAANTATVTAKKTSLESGDDSEEESEILEESPCGRWLKRREVVSVI